MKNAKWLMLALLAGCGTKAAADATSAEDAVADIAAVDDAVGDATGPTTTVYDAGADTAAADVPVKLSPAAQMCADIGAQIAAAAKTCCNSLAAGDWATVEADLCMKAGFAGIDDASAVSVVKLDAARGKACKEALDAAAKNCDYLGLQAARHQCLLAWVDTASKGDQCTATAPVPCDSFSGRCDPVTTDTYACRKVGVEGDACKLGSPCGVDLECLNGTLTRAMTCGKPGSTCNLSDTCPQGFQCTSGACVAWAAGGKAGATCKSNADCAVSFVCSAGTCAPSLCFATM
jgi:hypothetical protein